MFLPPPPPLQRRTPPLGATSGTYHLTTPASDLLGLAIPRQLETSYPLHYLTTYHYIEYPLFVILISVPLYTTPLDIFSTPVLYFL